MMSPNKNDTINSYFLESIPSIKSEHSSKQIKYTLLSIKFEIKAKLTRGVGSKLESAADLSRLSEECYTGLLYDLSSPISSQYSFCIALKTFKEVLEITLCACSIFFSVTQLIDPETPSPTTKPRVCPTTGSNFVPSDKLSVSASWTAITAVSLTLVVWKTLRLSCAIASPTFLIKVCSSVPA